MSFVEVSFVSFFGTVFVGYHLLYRRLDIQNLFIVAASAFFYAWWDERFLALLLLSIGSNYLAAIIIEERPATKKLVLATSIAINLGVLFVFKYFDFFVQSLSNLGDRIGVETHWGTLAFVLPIGISFYTFQSIAYTVDVYRGTLKAERSFVVFCAFISFFPQLVAGPIERAKHMLPQFNAPRRLNIRLIEKSIWFILWGYLLKVGVADNLAPFVDFNFRNDQIYGWSTVLGTIAFSLQIFGDFAGYSFIAKGVAGLFGIELVFNFRQPYCAISVQDFWRRWHISLSEFLRDYLYIPLGGSKSGAGRTSLNLLTVMIIGGLWHGASWTFLLWGLFHGVGLVIYQYWRKWTPADFRLPALVAWMATMVFVLFGWFLFRVPSGSALVSMLGAFGNWDWKPGHSALLSVILLVGVPLLAFEWVQYRFGSVSDRLPSSLQPLAIAAVILFVVSLSGVARPNFIYFQF